MLKIYARFPAVRWRKGHNTAQARSSEITAKVNTEMFDKGAATADAKLHH